jgi:predicted dehydrogenase
MRHIKALIGEVAIGAVNHIRIKRDEGFMADRDALIWWNSELSAGCGARRFRRAPS